MCLNSSHFPIPSQYRQSFTFDSVTDFAVEEITGINQSCPRCSILHMQEVQGLRKFTYTTQANKWMIGF